MMRELAGAAGVLPRTFGRHGLSALLVLIRLVRGPRAPDRVVAIDALTMLAISAIALLAVAAGEPMLLDVAVVLALVSFLGTVAYTLMFRRRGRGTDESVTWRDERPAAPTTAAPTAGEDGR